MTNLIHQVSEIQIPADLLRQVDMDKLVDDFRKSFKRLDDFKKARQTHENRSLGKKVLDVISLRDDMEKAHRDAVEVQADFSKAIGQLMVLSIVQSQHLQQQQKELAIQQGIIKDQTRNIEQHTQILHGQQEEQARQSTELGELFNEFMNLKGFAKERVQQIVAIAKDVEGVRAGLTNDVQVIRDKLIREVEDSLVLVASQLNMTLATVSEQVGSVTRSVDNHVFDMKRICTDLASTWQKDNAQMVETASSIGGSVATISEEVAMQKETVSALSDEVAADKCNLSDRVKKLENVTEMLASYRDAVESRIKKILIAVGLATMSSVASLAYVFSNM